MALATDGQQYGNGNTLTTLGQLIVWYPFLDVLGVFWLRAEMLNHNFSTVLTNPAQRNRRYIVHFTPLFLIVIWQNVATCSIPSYFFDTDIYWDHRISLQFKIYLLFAFWLVIFSRKWHMDVLLGEYLVHFFLNFCHQNKLVEVCYQKYKVWFGWRTSQLFSVFFIYIQVV